MFYRWWFFPLQCSNGKGRAQWEGVEIYPLFRPLRLEWCQKIDTNPCQSLALKDVNLCVKYVAGLWQERSGGFILRTSTWMAQGHLSPPRAFIYFSPQSIFHCPGLSSMFPKMSEAMSRNSHGKLGDKGRSMFEKHRCLMCFLEFWASKRQSKSLLFPMERRRLKPWCLHRCWGSGIPYLCWILRPPCHGLESKRSMKLTCKPLGYGKIYERTYHHLDSNDP